MTTRWNPHWSVLREYSGEKRRRVALPIGGIGTGTISLGGRGNLRDFEVVNRPAKGFAPAEAFFAVWARAGKNEPVARAAEGPIDPVEFEGASGSAATNRGLPRFRVSRFAAAYPLAQVALSDRDMPVDVRIEAFNPLVPADPDASGIPVAVFRFVLTNKTRRRVEASVCGNLQNFIGADGSADAKAVGNVNEWRSNPVEKVRGIFMRSTEVPAAAEQFGTLALVTTATEGVSHRTQWMRGSWGAHRLDFWDDFSADGVVSNPPESPDNTPIASLAAGLSLRPGATASVTFLLAWHFPNRQSWESRAAAKPPAERVGNYYATQYADAWDAAERTAGALGDLERKTVAFVEAFCASDLPLEVKESALNNVSVLRTQTCFRTEDGRFYGWEGCNDKIGCCMGSCTHVWNYEHVTGFLFGSLARSMREVEFGHATDNEGAMSFRVNLPLTHATEHRTVAADGQMGTILKLYREWRHSGPPEGEAMLRSLWPKARKALEYAWSDFPGAWDRDRDGVMEGCQHNTMDVEYFGPNAHMTVMYLGALRAAEEMARVVGEEDFARTCRDLFERGSRKTDSTLFNGEYYFHDIQPIADSDAIPAPLRLGKGPVDTTDPPAQIGPGCEVNQLFGQLWARIVGLGDLVDRGHARAALRAMMKHNFRRDLSDHFNFLRAYALGSEAGLLMCTWPHGGRPRRPFPYATEVWTGCEYVVAAHLIYERLTADALKILRAVRARHDGMKRNPFNEPECGHHYVRAMASWALPVAWTGFHYDAPRKHMTFGAVKKATTWFWSTGDAWGTVMLKPVAGGITGVLSILHGSVTLSRIQIAGVGETGVTSTGRVLRFKVKKS